MKTDDTQTPDTEVKTPDSSQEAHEPADTPALQPDRHEAATPETSQIAATDLLELIRAAEERGYRKGIDEAARKNIEATNGLWCAPEARAQTGDYDTGSEILKTIRPGVWDI